MNTRVLIAPALFAACTAAHVTAYGQAPDPAGFRPYQPQPAAQPAGLINPQPAPLAAPAASSPAFHVPPAAPVPAPVNQPPPAPPQYPVPGGTFGAPCPPVGVAAIDCAQYATAMKDLLAIEIKIQEEILWTKKVRAAGFGLAAIVGPVSLGTLVPAAGVLGALVDPTFAALAVPPVLLEIVGLVMVNVGADVEQLREDQTKILRGRYGMPWVGSAPGSPSDEMRENGMTGAGFALGPPGMASK